MERFCEICEKSLTVTQRKCCSRTCGAAAAGKLAAEGWKNKRKICLHCKSEFAPTGPHQPWCRTCCPEDVSGSAGALLRKFELSWPEFQSILHSQNDTCALCPKTLNEHGKNFHVDHDHETGRVRGLLCFRCNVGLSHVERDDFAWVKTAMAYLNESHDHPGEGWSNHNVTKFAPVKLQCNS